MSVTLNLKKGVDLPYWQWLSLPATLPGHGGAFAYDGSRFLYIVCGSRFFRYDTWTDAWNRLANPLGGTAHGGALTYCRTTDKAYYLRGNGTRDFYEYDIATDTWTALDDSPQNVSWAAFLVHTCSTIKAGVNDDYIYMSPGYGLAYFYRYSISGNSWSAMTSIPFTVYYGCFADWVWNYDDDKIYVHSTMGHYFEVYSILNNNWTTVTYTPADIDEYDYGTSGCYDPFNDRIYKCTAGTRRLTYIDLATLKQYPLGTKPYSVVGSSSSHRKMYCLKQEDVPFLYFIDGIFVRLLLHW